MRRFFTSLLVVVAFCTAIIAAVQTELRMHVFSNGDNGQNIVKALAEVDSVKFTYDTLEYKVTFMDWDGTVLQSGILLAGETPKYEGEKNPTREQTAKYTYNFKGWTPEIEEVQDEATYTADYDSTIRKYVVVFLSMNGEILSTDLLDYGTMPNYSGEISAKENTKLYDYKPVWKPSLAEVTGNVTYKADIDSTKHEYTCIFNDYDGTELYKTTNGTYDYEWTTQPNRDETIDYVYYFKEWSLDESQIEDNVLIYTAVYDSVSNTKKDGALVRASYKVSSTKSVYFSQGNLQFNAVRGTHVTADGDTVAGTWRFAENQYDCIGLTNNKISSTYNGWIDLFGKGTSGWSSNSNAYQPWAISEEVEDYLYSDLTGKYANADWGVYNAISNGGNEPNKWRTLTFEEWEYLIQHNKWTLGYIKTAEKDSSLCFFLIPKGFVEPSDVKVTVISTSITTSGYGYCSDEIKTSSYASNSYTVEQFEALEKLGVVALPCGGERSGATVSNIGLYGCYWASSVYTSFSSAESSGGVISFKSSYVCWRTIKSRFYGLSVRLVQDVQ